jgi:hypothetical protein
MDQPTLKPTNKVSAATAAGAASILLVFVLGELGVDLTSEAAAAVATLLAFAGGYFTRERVPDREDVRVAASRAERKPTRRNS